MNEIDTTNPGVPDSRDLQSPSPAFATQKAAADKLRELAEFLSNAADLVEQGELGSTVKLINLTIAEFQSTVIQELKTEYARRNKVIAAKQRASSVQKTLEAANPDIKLPGFLRR